MDKAQRPPEIRTQATETGAESDAPLERESSLLPGMVRTPSRLFAADIDWAAPGSVVWEETGGCRPKAAVQTPLTGYGENSEAWASATASPLLNEDGGETNATSAYVGAKGEDRSAETPEMRRAAAAAALAAAALEAIRKENRPSQPLHPRVGGPFTTNAAAATANHRGTAHQPYAVQPSFFTVQEGGKDTESNRNAAVHGIDAGPAGITVTEQYSRQPLGTAGRPHGAAGNALPTLEDKQVAQSIIASAGLPLSMSSLVSYIKKGQPHFVEQDHGGMEAAIYGTTGAHRNYPNLSEPPPQPPQPQQQPLQQPPMGGYGGYGRGNLYGGEANYTSMQSGVPNAGNRNDDWTGVAGAGSTGGGGGWNVQANSPSVSPVHPSPPYGSQGRGAGGDVGYGFRGARGGGVGFSLPPAESKYPQHQPIPQGPYGTGPSRYGSHPTRPKSESEILSDLLHFHANFFPPPPPPRVPNEQKRNRADLWYHYASKWDITHRLPPPPRNPLPEMELEYIMQLPEMTRVPYHGDGWLNMSERWFIVTQSLFDFPEENVGVQLDAAVVLEQAVTS